MRKTKLKRVVMMCLAMGLTVVPARSQAPDVRSLFAGLEAPLTLQMQDLNTRFTRISVTGSSDSGLLMQMVGGANGALENYYFTQGVTITVGSETYLLAYRPQVALDPRAFNPAGHGERPLQVRPGPNTYLTLCMLNLRTSGSLNDVRAFDAKLDIRTDDEGNSLSQRNLMQLGRGVLSFLAARGDTFPVIGRTVTPELRRAFYPYVTDAQTYVHPATEVSYIPNPLLSGKKASAIRNRPLVWLFVEGKPAEDGTRRVLFADGHVESMDAARWSRVQQVIILMNVTHNAAAKVGDTPVPANGPAMAP